MTTKNHTTDPEITRILFALDAVEPDDPVAMAAVIRLAERMGAELVGLLVEDSNLQRLADLPFAREIVYSSATVRRIDPPSLRRALRVRREALRERFESSAARARIRHSFHTAACDLLSETLSLSPEADMLVLSALGGAWGPAALARRLARQARCTVLLQHPEADLERPVVALFDESPSGRRVLTIAAQLARRDGHNLVVLLPASDGDSIARMREKAREYVAHYGIEADYHQLDKDTAEALTQAVAAADGNVLVIGGDAPLAAQERYREWAPALRCAVVLVR